jgi:hypothetical protein
VNPAILEQINEKFQTDEAFIKEILSTTQGSFKYILKEWQMKQEMILIALKHDIYVLHELDDELSSNKDYLLYALKDRKKLPGGLFSFYRADYDLIFEAINRYEYDIYDDLPKWARLDEDLMLLVIKKSSWNIRYLSDELKNNLSFCKKLLMITKKAAIDIPNHIKSHPEIQAILNMETSDSKKRGSSKKSKS